MKKCQCKESALQQTESWTCSWCVKNLNHLSQNEHWKISRPMEYGTGRWMPQQPQPVEFANMFQRLFAGNLGMPMAQPCLTETSWTVADLKKAVARLKANKAADDVGLLAELLHHSSEVML